jgi:hypothetical protein
MVAMTSGDRTRTVPRVLLDHIVRLFEGRKWIVVDFVAGGRWEIVHHGAELKRWLES